MGMTNVSTTDCSAFQAKCWRRILGLAFVLLAAMGVLYWNGWSYKDAVSNAVARTETVKAELDKTSAVRVEQFKAIEEKLESMRQWQKGMQSDIGSIKEAVIRMEARP